MVAMLAMPMTAAAASDKMVRRVMIAFLSCSSPIEHKERFLHASFDLDQCRVPD
jgi:hypothetical protein